MLLHWGSVFKKRFGRGGYGYLAHQGRKKIPGSMKKAQKEKCEESNEMVRKEA